MRPCFAISSLFLLSLPVFAQTKPSQTVPLENRAQARGIVAQLLREGKIMRSSDAKRGMKGYGISVFQGTKLEKFDVEVVGTLEKVMGGGDLVLIKVTSGPVVKRNTGIIAGMSGSPVYFNGKMLGAIAIGFGFPKEPIGGVTPITQMIETALPDNTPPKPPLQVAKTTLKNTPKNTLGEEVFAPKAPLQIAGRNIERVIVSRDPKRLAFSGPGDRATMTMRPATQLLQMSGISAASLPRLKKVFAPYGLEPVLGGGKMTHNQVFGVSSKKLGIGATFQPGSAIGVQLVSGDLDMTGVGTITFRWGNRILAFGHPMLGLGATSMPMTTAYIHDIFPSYQQSFKLASPMATVGALQQDTNFAIGGTVRAVADTVPMRIFLRDREKQILRNFRVHLVKDAALTPQLALSVAVEAMTGTLGEDSDKMVRVGTNLTLADGSKIYRKNYLYADDMVVGAALQEVIDPILLTQGNTFERGAIKSLDISLDIESGRKTARIRRIFADRNKVKAGETVRLSVVLEPTGKGGDAVTRTFSFPVPDDAPDGNLRLVASAGSQFWQARTRVGAPMPRAANLKELVQSYGQIGSDNELLVQASTPRTFLLVDRKKVPNPPPSWTRLVPPGPSSSIGVYNEVQERRETADFALSGMEVLTIPVESARHTDRERPDSPANSDTNSGATPAASADATAADAATPAAPDDSDDDDGTDVSGAITPASIDELPLLSDQIARMRRLMTLLKSATSPALVKPSPSPALTPAPGATPGVTPGATPTATPTPTPDTAGATTIARPVGRWIQGKSADFARGTFEGAAVSDDGRILPAPGSKRLISTPEPVAFSIAGDSAGNVYLGTGLSARLYKIAPDGSSKVLYEGPEVAVTALTTDSAGNLFAGVTPGGRVYRFRPDGTRDTILEVPNASIWDLKWDSAGQLLVATGGETGAVYQLDPNAAPQNPALPMPTPFARVPQRHIRTLAVRGSEIFAGTSDEAVLYRIGADGTTTALYQAPDTPAQRQTMNGPTNESGGSFGGLMGGNAAFLILAAEMRPGLDGSIQSQTSGQNEILSLAADENGVYFGTAATGTVYRWNAQTGVSDLFKTPGRAVYSLRRAQDGSLLAGTGEKGEIYQILPAAPGRETRAARLLDPLQPQTLALALAPNGDLLAATGNNAAAYRIALSGVGDGLYTSNILDAGQIVRWGALRAVATETTLETRSGNTLEPDASWSQWQPVEADGDQFRIVSPSARYLQYRARLATTGPASLSRVEVVFRAPNRAPTVTFTLPTGGEFLAGKKTLTWSGTDPDKDALRYKLSLKKEGGEWQTVELKSATAASFELDTTKSADGIYRAKIEASDAARNPDEPLRDEATSLPFTIDNTAPENGAVTVVRAEIGWDVQLSASDALSPLGGAEWRVAPAEKTTKPGDKKDEKAKSDDKAKTDDKKDEKTPDWQAAAAQDGLFDSKSEVIVARLDAAMAGVSLAAGTKIEIRVRDAAGNAKTSTVVLP